MEGWRNNKETAAFVILLTALLSGIIIGQAQEAPRDVNGIVGGSALLSLIVAQGVSVLEVRWRSVTNNIRLGDSKGRTFERFYLANPTVTLRLEMESATTLRITNLMKNDSGIYKAEVQYEDGFNEEKAFQLKVYDPVPVPHIEKESLSNTSDGCNVTLVCQISSGSDLNFRWVKRDTKNSKYQNISDGQTLQLSLNVNLKDSEYFCLVSNPVDEKNTSTSHYCHKGPPLKTRVLGYIIIPFALIILSILGLFIYLQMNKKKKRKDEADRGVYFLAGPEEAGQPLVTYASIPRRPPDGNEEVGYYSLEDCSTNLQENNQTATTVYQKIQPHLQCTPAEGSKMEVD